MRLLITGGLGFIGGRIAAHLAQSGHSIILGSRKAINPPAWLPQAEVTQIHWEDIASLERSCKDVDIVIQAAGMNAQDCANDPVGALAFNGVATSRMVEAACHASVQRFIYLSTAHVYDSPLEGTITEKTCPRNLHPYATSHLAGENAVLSAVQRGLIQGIVLRLSNAFGAPMHKDVNCWMLLVNDLCRQAVQTGKLVFRTGWQQRDFIAMTEVCHAIERLIIRNQDEDYQNGIVNVGAGVSESVLGMTKMIQQRCVQVLGFEPELQHKEDLKEEIRIPFVYQTIRLEKFTMNHGSANNIVEIDNLLRYCKTIFSCAKN
jgi:UDP-glucose 4-epimerase